MTNAQKWVSAFLVLFILLLVLSKITNRQESETYEAEKMVTENVESPANESSEISVEDLLANNRCYTCHGNDLNGTGMGPSLAKISENWEKISLVSYFKNPKAFLSNPRMAVIKENYNRDMPAQETMTQEELETLADYLLTRK